MSPDPDSTEVSRARMERVMVEIIDLLTATHNLTAPEGMTALTSALALMLGVQYTSAEDYSKGVQVAAKGLMTLRDTSDRTDVGRELAEMVAGMRRA